MSATATHSRTEKLHRITAAFFSNKSEKILNFRNILAIIPSGILCIACYSIYEGVVMAGGF